jgi:hypothetical protein
MSKKRIIEQILHRRARKLKWYNNPEYWTKSFKNFKSFFVKDRPWYKSLAEYIYLENSIFNFFHRYYRAVYRFFENIIRVAKWLPILWRDRDFDYAFFWPILRKKIENMDKVITNGSSATNLTVKAELMYVRALLERIESFDYYKEVQNNTPSNSSSNIFADENLRQEDIEKLFAFMAKNHTKWWD